MRKNIATLRLIAKSDTYPAAFFRRIFLNSGLFMGRGFALKDLLRNPVPDNIRYSDQAWYQQKFLSPESPVRLDTDVVLLCAANTVNGKVLNNTCADHRFWHISCCSSFRWHRTLGVLEGRSTNNTSS